MFSIISVFLFSFFVTENSAAQNFITPQVSTILSESVSETSGLANLDGEIWTHNDSGDDPLLYQISSTNGSVLRTVEIVNATNDDWEDIANDDNFVYVGDIGNNWGDRSDLKIYRISRAALAVSDFIYAEVIHYSYSDQTSWEPNHNNHDFDCEAMICYQDKLYLFSKNWVDNMTRCYELPNQPGTHVAEYQSTFDINCLVSGAEILPENNTLVLIGYNTSGGTYSWLFDGFTGNNFFNGNDTKLIWTTLTQIEGVCWAEDQDVYVSSEEFAGLVDPTLYYMDITGYLTGISTYTEKSIDIFASQNNVLITANTGQAITGTVRIMDTSGKTIHQIKVENQMKIQFSVNLSSGVYIIHFISPSNSFQKKVFINQ